MVENMDFLYSLANAAICPVQSTSAPPSVTLFIDDDEEDRSDDNREYFGSDDGLLGISLVH